MLQCSPLCWIEIEACKLFSCYVLCADGPTLGYGRRQVRLLEVCDRRRPCLRSMSSACILRQEATRTASPQSESSPSILAASTLTLSRSILRIMRRISSDSASTCERKFLKSSEGPGSLGE